jgi:hypothetical protein
VRRWFVDERERAAVEPGRAHEHACRNVDVYPSFFQNVDGETSFARSRFTIDTEVVFDARERRIHWRRLGGRVRRKGLQPQRPIVVDGNHDPTVGSRRLLCEDE